MKFVALLATCAAVATGVAGCSVSTGSGSDSSSTTTTSTVDTAQVKRVLDARFTDRADRIAQRNSTNSITATVKDVTVVQIDAETGNALVRETLHLQSVEFPGIQQTRTSLYKVKFNTETGYLRSVHGYGSNG